MSRVDDHLPERLFTYLRSGVPALLLTTGEDGFPNVAYSWAIAPDGSRVRFGADHGSATLANLQRDGRAALEIIGPANLLFLVKGSTRLVKDRISAAPFRIALMEMTVIQVKDQSFPGVDVAPLAFEWHADQREAMLAMEQAVYAEMLGGKENAMERRDTGKVNINRNPQVPEGSALPYPTHKVLGIIPSQEAAWQAIDELKSRDFPEEEIELWTGPAGSRAIEESYTRSGIIERLKRVVQKLGEEGDFIRGYDEALQKGEFLLVVPATGEESKKTVRDIMVMHGGHFVSYYDYLTIETLA